MPSLDVGTVAVALPGPEWYVPVRNEGPSTFTPARCSPTTPSSPSPAGPANSRVPVPSASCTVKIVLTPLERAAHGATSPSPRTSWAARR
ncbi:MAG: hypothetical protein R2713_11560 [Ilumatobacteraceae bacterium]